ncbi:hypothetical protein [Paracoccus sp. N5]|uniref:hypothetical protein n=1 Tax=Paracoccus sp. N5 TaxID=1101189 RepID=UPI0012F9F9EF|nr:hypothetical protein [Paracoccus sp. N5]
MRKKPSEEGILQEMSRRFSGGDNFDHTDLVWTGINGSLDPDDFIEERGWDFRSPLEQILFALIAGYQRDAKCKELKDLVRKVSSLITGEKDRGNALKDDGALLLEIARRWHKEYFELGRREPKLAPICRGVVTDYASEVRGAEYFDIENISKVLERKFKEDRDLWLVRATAGDGYYAPERMNGIDRIKFALTSLQDAGVAVDLERVRPTMPPSVS